jgi:hypothetical protein
MEMMVSSSSRQVFGQVVVLWGRAWLADLGGFSIWMELVLWRASPVPWCLMNEMLRLGTDWVQEMAFAGRGSGFRRSSGIGPGWW